MKILITPFNWFVHNKSSSGVAGGEIYLSRLCSFLQSQGHEIKAIVFSTEYYEHNGIECYPMGETHKMFVEHNDLFQWCDVVITQLIGSSYGYNKANQHKKPLIFIAHNNSTSYCVQFSQHNMCHMVYNSFQLRDDLYKTYGHFNGTVLHPILPKFDRSTKGKYITLVNCNDNKGGKTLVELAKQLPQYEFLGVHGGYDAQIIECLPNLIYLPNGSDMQEVYSKSKIVIVPSRFESFSQVALEAMICGIPVIATPTTGLLENLSGAGIFVEHGNIEKYVQNIVALMNNENVWQKQSDIVFERAQCLRDKSEIELNKFNEWITKIK